MASRPTSDLQFITSSGTVLQRPPEWSRGFLVLCCETSELGAVVVARNDLRLDVSIRSIDDVPTMVAAWPPADVGNYDIGLSWADGRPERHHRITVLPSKLDQSELEELVRSLQEELPASLAFALSRRRAMAGVTLLPPACATPEQELNHLRRAVQGSRDRPGLLTLLRSIARQPHQVLETEIRWTQADRARQIHAAGLAQAFGRPGNVGREQRLTSVPEVRVRHATDVHENRIVRHYHDQISSRLKALIVLRGRPTITTEAEALSTELRSARRAASFLDAVDLPVSSPTATESAVMFKRPDYRAIGTGIRDLARRGVIRMGEDGLEAPLANAPRLYERWLTYQVIVALLQLGQDFGYQQEAVRLVRRHDHEFLVDVLPGGNTAIVELLHPNRQVTVRLFVQRVYTPQADDLHSVSFRQIPDIAIEISKPEGHDIVILDAKYKLASERDGASAQKGRPAKADVDAMHAYTDAIRDGAGDRVVRYAAVLYPGRTVTFGEQIAALRARPSERDRLQTELRAVLMSFVDAVE